MSCFRVKYRMDYNNSTGLYRMPKAPELIKIAHAEATDIFFDSLDNYSPIWVDVSTLNEDYGGYIFFNVTDNKNMIVTSEEITGDCLNSVYTFIKYTP